MTPDEKRAYQREYMRKWREASPEKARAYQEGYRARPDNREKARQRARAWYYANRERAATANKARYARQPKKGRASGEAHHLWKGEAVSYGALHRWVVRHKGKPSECEHCGTSTAKKYEWANVDHTYKRNLDDWLRLCTSCHRRYDYEHGLCEKGGPRRRAA